MGLFNIVGEAELARRIQNDGITATSIIRSLISHYFDTKARMIEFVQHPEVDDTDLGSLVSSLNEYIVVIDALRSQVAGDRDEFAAMVGVAPEDRVPQPEEPEVEPAP